MALIFFNVQNDDINSDKVYRLRTEWSGNDCDITILAGNSVFSGKLKDRDGICKIPGWSEQDCIDACKAALQSNNNDNQFSYRLEKEVFCIRKLNPNSKVKLAMIKLKKIDFEEAAILIFDGARKHINGMSAEIQELRKDNDCLRRGYEMNNNLILEKFEQKETMEKILYGPFLKLLNSKKKFAAMINPDSIKDKNDLEEELDENEPMEVKNEGELDLHENELMEVKHELEELNENSSIFDADTEIDDKVEEKPIPQAQTLPAKMGASVTQPISEARDNESSQTDKYEANSRSFSSQANLENKMDAMGFFDLTVRYKG